MNKLESFKLIVETLLLCMGIIYAAAFAWRTWPYPSGALSLVESKRVHQTAGDSVSIIFDSKFSLGARSNFDVENVETECLILNSDRACKLDCFDVQKELSSGRISSGDSFTWSCKASEAALEDCVLAAVKVTGKAPFPTWKQSSWWAKGLSCPANIASQ